MPTKTKEKVLKYLLEHQSSYKINTASFSAGKYNDISMSFNEFVSILETLKSKEFIEYRFYGHIAPISSCDVKLLEPAINYRFNKKKINKDMFKLSIREIIIACISSICSLIFASLLSR